MGKKYRKSNIEEMAENEWLFSVWKSQRGHSLIVHKHTDEKMDVIELCVFYGMETRSLAIELQQGVMALDVIGKFFRVKIGKGCEML